MKKLKLYYVGKKGINFGDSINPIVFERIFDISVERAYPTYADAAGIGSILGMLTLANISRYKKFLYLLKYSSKPIFTLGTGFMFDYENPYFFYKTYRPINPLILRGKLTHATLEKINQRKYEDVTYGDLGLIFPYLLEEKIDKKFELGVIPHISDYNNPVIEKLLTQSNRSILINLRDDSLKVLKTIAQCDTVISSSLHGLIAADSLNIPNKRIKLSNHNFSQDIDYKFADYYTALDVENHDCVNFIDTEPDEENLSKLTPKAIIEDYKINFSKVKSVQAEIMQKGREFKEIL